MLGLFAFLGIPWEMHATIMAAGLLLIGFVAVIWWAAVVIEKAQQNDSETRLNASVIYFPQEVSSSDSGSLASSDLSTRSQEFIQQLRQIDWYQFEKIVELVYRKQGYSVERRGGANADGGIDLVIERDGERFAVQCKHWKTWDVGVKVVRELLGAMLDANIGRGKLVTLGGYTGQAKELADKHRIEMVNETDLVAMLRATDAPYDPQVLEIMRDTTKYCPKCEREMVLRTAGKGAGAGRQFWGCSGYPRCRYTMPA